MAQLHHLKNLSSRVRRVAVGGTASIVGTAVANNALRIVSSMTLTRLLSSEAFGVVGIISSVAFVIALISDIGIYPFILRHKESHERDFLDEIWTMRFLRAIGLTLLMAFLAWPVARFTQKPELGPVFLVWSLSFLIEGFSSLSFVTAVLNRQLWRLTIADLLVAVLQLFISIGLALWLQSYWALIFAMLSGNVARTVLSYTMFADSGRRFRLNRPRARELWSFSRIIAMSSFLTMIIMQSDKLILARLMPLSTYGLYAIAVTLAAAPLAVVPLYTSRILYPAYADAARAQPSQLAGLYYAKRRLVTLAYMMAAGGMIGGATLVIALLYDPRYRPVVPFLQLLTFSTALALANSAADEALIATGRQQWALYSNIARAIWLLIGGVVAVLLHNVMLLIAVFGMVELAAMLCSWWGLKRVGVLRLGEEALGFVVLGFGVGLGLVIARAALWLLPTL